MTEPWTRSDCDACMALVMRASRPELEDVEKQITTRRRELREQMDALEAKARVLREVELEAQKAQGPYGPDQRVSLHGSLPDGVTPGAPLPIDPATGQHADYYVLSEAERAKGFVRVVRHAYTHLTCGSTTTMGQALAETYARDPKFYGSTFCCNCRGHFPVGEHGEFVWDGTEKKVGT